MSQWVLVTVLEAASRLGESLERGEDGEGAEFSLAAGQCSREAWGGQKLLWPDGMGFRGRGRGFT